MQDSIVTPNWLVALAAVGCAAVWAMIIGRLRSGRAIVEREPRSDVPWGGPEVAIGLLLALFTPILCVWMLGAFSDRNGDDLQVTAVDADAILVDESARQAATAADELDSKEDGLGDPVEATAETDSISDSTAHPIARLLSERGDAFTMLVCVLAAIIVAPLAEEFFFRVLLQGWLESREEGWRARLSMIDRLPVGCVSILLSSAGFALLHLRSEAPDLEPERVLRGLVSGALGSIAALAFTILLLRSTCGATWGDLGFDGTHWRRDTVLGLVALPAVVFPVYVLQWSLYAAQEWLHDVAPQLPVLAPDPVPLFFLACVLGFLYQRTHRLAPSIVLHVVFNAIPMAFLWTSVRG